MKQTIPYGPGMVEVTLLEQAVSIEPKDVPEYDEQAVLAEAMRNPVGAGSIEEFLAEGEKVLIIVNDVNRRCLLRSHARRLRDRTEIPKVCTKLGFVDP